MRGTENRVKAFIESMSGSLKYCNLSLARGEHILQILEVKWWIITDDKIKHLTDEQSVLSTDRGYIYLHQKIKIRLKLDKSKKNKLNLLKYDVFEVIEDISLEKIGSRLDGW